MSIAVIIPSIGRKHLGDLVASLVPQLTPLDQIVVEMDLPHSGEFGNHARDLAFLRSNTTHVWNLDDDDIALPGAMDAIRAAILEDPLSAWFFKVRCGGGVVWKEERLRTDGQSGQCYVYPKKAGPEWNAKRAPLWGDRPDQTDYQIGERLQDTFGFKWNKAIIAELGVGK